MKEWRYCTSRFLTLLFIGVSMHHLRKPWLLRTVRCPYLKSAVSVSDRFSLCRNLSLAEKLLCFLHWFFRLLMLQESPIIWTEVYRKIRITIVNVATATIKQNMSLELLTWRCFVLNECCQFDKQITCVCSGVNHRCRQNIVLRKVCVMKLIIKKFPLLLRPLPNLP